MCLLQISINIKNMNTQCNEGEFLYKHENQQYEL